MAFSTASVDSFPEHSRCQPRYCDAFGSNGSRSRILNASSTLAIGGRFSTRWTLRKILMSSFSGSILLDNIGAKAPRPRCLCILAAGANLSSWFAVILNGDVVLISEDELRPHTSL